MKKIISAVLFAAIVLLPSLADAQAAGNYLYNNESSFSTERASIPIANVGSSNISLKAEVMMNVIATSYTAIFSVSQQGKDVNQVDSLMNARIDFVMFGLEKLGLPKEAVHVDAVSMVPTFTTQIEEKKFSKKVTEIPVGFEMKKNIHVLFKQHRLLDEILSIMAYADIYDMIKVEYNIDGLNKYYEELRKNAIEVIRSKEDTYKALTMHLEILGMADGSSCTYPFERYKNYNAANSGASVQVVESTKRLLDNVTVMGHGNTINVTQSKEQLKNQFLVQNAEKNRTIFYDRMPYNQFDRIINPDMGEPCIQIFYNLQVSYNVLNDQQYQQQQKLLEAQKQGQQVQPIKSKKQLRMERKARKPRAL